MKLNLVAAVIAGLSIVGSATANTTTDLGAASVGTPLAFGGYAAVGTFIDTFTFTLPSNGGSGYSVTNFTYLPGQFNTIFSSLALYADNDAIPFNGGETTLTSVAVNGGSASLTWGSSPAGNYILTVAGATNGTQGGIYNGALTVSAVPEPETYAMMLAGLGALGFLARRRKS
jgi:hypothetical protein